MPGPGEVRLRSRVTGVCGTDVHLHDGEFFPVYPLIPGHEVIGEVDMLGEQAEGLAIGQLVALDNMLTCGLCDKCRQGRPNFCRHLRALGVTDPVGSPSTSWRRRRNVTRSTISTSTQLS